MAEPGLFDDEHLVIVLRLYLLLLIYSLQFDFQGPLDFPLLHLLSLLDSPRFHNQVLLDTSLCDFLFLFHPGNLHFPNLVDLSPLYLLVFHYTRFLSNEFLLILHLYGLGLFGSRVGGNIPLHVRFRPGFLLREAEFLF